MSNIDDEHLELESSVSTKRESFKSSPRESVNSTREESVSNNVSQDLAEKTTLKSVTPTTKASNSNELNSSNSTAKRLIRTKSTIADFFDIGGKSLKKTQQTTDATPESNTSLDASLTNITDNQKLENTNLKQNLSKTLKAAKSSTNLSTPTSQDDNKKPKTILPKLTITSLNENNIVKHMDDLAKKIAENKELRTKSTSPLRNTTNLEERVKEMANILNLETKVAAAINSQKDATSPVVISSKTSSDSFCSGNGEKTCQKQSSMDETEKSCKKRKRESTGIVEGNINSNNILDILNKFKSTTPLPPTNKVKSPFLSKSPLPQKSSATKENGAASTLRQQKLFSGKKSGTLALNSMLSDSEQEFEEDLENTNLNSSRDDMDKTKVSSMKS